MSDASFSHDEGVKILRALTKLLAQRVLAGDKYAEELLLTAINEARKQQNLN